MRLVKNLIILIFVLVPSLCHAVTVISSLPYTCSASGEYELSGNLSSATNGIIVSASNVSIDLKGYVLTWGTGEGEDVHGVQTGWNKSGLVVYSSVAGGELLHGATTNPAGCNGVFGQEVSSGFSIHDIKITVKSKADDNSLTACIVLKRARNPQIYNNELHNQASSVVNRHSVPASVIKCELDTVTASTNVDIYNNDCYSVHSGISVSGKTTGTEAVMVTDNYVITNQIAPNAYAIGFGYPGGAVNSMTNVHILRNTIRTTGSGGRGIIGSHTDYYVIKDNDIIVGEAATLESTHTNGLRLRYGARFGLVEDNYIKILCGQSGYTGGYGAYVNSWPGLDLSNPQDIDVSFINNTIEVDNQSSSVEGIALRFGNFKEGHNWTINGNTITTNDTAIKFGPDVNGDRAIRELILQNTTINKTTPASGVTFYSYTYRDSGDTSSDMETYVCGTTYTGGALETDIVVDPSGVVVKTFDEVCLEDTTPPTLNNVLPSGVQVCTSDPRNITLQGTSNEASTWKYSLTDQAYDDMPNTFGTTGGTIHNQVLSLACDASYTYYLRGMDTAGNKSSSSIVVSFSIAAAADVDPAMLSNALPIGEIAYTTDPVDVTLEIDSSEPVTIRSSTTNKTYDEMELTWETTGGTEHSHVLSVPAGVERTYYVRSMDTSGNVNTTSTMISFSTAPNPTPVVPIKKTTIGGAGKTNIGAGKTNVE